ncbi:hypothetical protein PGTUg99_003071 [Puccinia graminis f. sp. tritici]|uniref:Uncharacterized protein n=1 Tax=Puccinia graminis f. sp. tritici TaxID=56615 RepID=A0A5B0MM20_PUCGR|nr:hypothetical protein PGTUg99_003071 [Puccinia graminis f. sp. tritici]
MAEKPRVDVDTEKKRYRPYSNNNKKYLIELAFAVFSQSNYPHSNYFHRPSSSKTDRRRRTDRLKAGATMPSLSRLTRSYERAFKHHPSLTLAITNGCLKCLGDFLAQYLPAFFLERRIPLTGGRATSNNGVTDPGATPEMEQEDLRLIETEKSLTSHRPISIRSRSTTGPEHHPGALRGLSNSDAPLSSFPHNSNQHLTGLSKLGNPTRAAATGFRVFGLLKRILLDQLLIYRVPWQGSCGVLWTVFLSLSTHSSTHYSSSTTTVDPTGPTLVASTLSKLFKSGNSSASDPHIISSNHLANSSSASSSSPSSNDPSSPIKRKNNRVIG